MNHAEFYGVAFIVAFLITLVTTPFIKKIAIWIGATDQPNQRKVHQVAMPRLGGLAIVLGTVAGLLFLMPEYEHFLSIVVGGLLILVIGVLDDKYVLSAKVKLLGQVVAALIPTLSGVVIGFFTVPFTGDIHFLGVFGYVVTVLWIIGITNAINLMDGLDGLAGGVSVIGLTTILITAIINHQFFVIAIATVLIGSTLGFLVFNFHPAKIFMGDTGAMFLGYMLAVISVLGLFKSLATFSIVIPILILAVPIFDTLFAIIRRLVRGQKISAPDKSHLHHCLLDMGFSHRSTVLIIYSIASLFGIAAVIFSNSTLWGSLLIFILTLLVMQTTAEIIGLIGERHRLVLNAVKRLVAVTQSLKK